MPAPKKRFKGQRVWLTASEVKEVLQAMYPTQSADELAATYAAMSEGDGFQSLVDTILQHFRVARYSAMAAAPMQQVTPVGYTPVPLPTQPEPEPEPTGIAEGASEIDDDELDDLFG